MRKFISLNKIKSTLETKELSIWTLKKKLTIKISLYKAKNLNYISHSLYDVFYHNFADAVLNELKRLN